MKRWLQERLVAPLLAFLRQGVTPEKLALSVALGIVLGVFPALGWTSALCAIAAFALGLNLPAIQLVNFFVYPAQVLLLLPFFRLGEIVFRAPHLPISIPRIYELASTSLWGAIRLLWETTWHAIVVWAVLSPLIAAPVYFSLRTVFRKIAQRGVPELRIEEIEPT